MTILCNQQLNNAQFKKVKLPFDTKNHIKTDPKIITSIADKTYNFLDKIHKSTYVTVNPGIFIKYGITMDDIKNTMKFITETGKKNPHLLQDPKFFNENFDIYRWYSDTHGGSNIKLYAGHYGAPNFIRTTAYRTLHISGSNKKTKKYNYPLYSVPLDEKNIKRNTIQYHLNTLLRFKYTRSQILNGSLNNNPLTNIIAWVTHKEYKELVMQGSAIISLNKNTKIKVRISGNNNKKGEESYWFWHIVTEKQSLYYPVKIEPIPEVTFAGNISDLGFGKFIILKSRNQNNNKSSLYLGALIDTGNAFKNNLHQLDIYMGEFETTKQFDQAIKTIPHTAEAYILIKKATSNIK